MKLLRFSCWYDDAYVVIDFVSINGGTGLKEEGRWYLTPERANDLADKLRHAVNSGLISSPRRAG